MYKFENRALPLEERLQDLLQQLTLDEKLHLLSTHHMPVERLGMGEWYIGQEVARGYVSRKKEEPSTVFPQPIGLASTFNPNLMEQLGEICGEEARYYNHQDPNGHLMVWGPTVDPERDPRWGRTEEAYGEDPFLIGEMTAAYTGGMAGNDPKYLRVIPTLKHFCANNHEEDRVRDSANVSPRTLHEYYYRAFEGAIVRGGAHSVMTAYNELAGVPACMNPDLQRVLKDQWKLDFIVTDGADFSQNVLAHRSHTTHAEALAECLHSGCDVMTDDTEMVAAAGRDALERGLITEQDLDIAVGNALRGRFKLGQFDGEDCIYNVDIQEPDQFLYRAVNHIAAREQFCLLENKGILPLDATKQQKIAVLGPLADEVYRDWYTGISSYQTTVLEGMQEQFGKENILFDNGYDWIKVQAKGNQKYCTLDAENTVIANAENAEQAEVFQYHDWDFDAVNWKSCTNGKYVIEDKDGTYRAVSETPYEWFIREKLKPQPVGDSVRIRTWSDKPMDLTLQENGTLRSKNGGSATEDRLFQIETISSGTERCVKLAKEADVVVLCLGNHPMQVARECYDRPSINLPKHQKELCKAICEANPNTVVLLVSSYPFAIGEEKEMAAAVLYSTHAGPELGSTAAETICGDNNPAARCPITWYHSDSELAPITEYDIIEADRTYLYDKTEPLYPFGYGLSYSQFVYSDFHTRFVKEGLVCDLYVENVSDRDGDEVVQIYFHHNDSCVKRPIRQLCGFRRIRIDAHQKAEVSLFIPWYALEYYDVVSEKMMVEPGEYTFYAGASSKDIRCESVMTLQGTSRDYRDLSQETKAIQYDEKDGMDVHMWYSYPKHNWFMESSDWGGSLFYKKAAFRNYTKAVVQAVAPCAGGGVEIFAGKQKLGSVEISPGASKDDFQEYTIPLTAWNGEADLMVHLQGQIALYSIKFFEK